MIFTFWTTDPAEPQSSEMTPLSIAAWREHYPDMQVFSSEDAIAILAEFGAEYVELFRRIRIPACQSDLARLLLLYRHGGLYVDSHTGPGDPWGLVEVLDKLSTHDLIVFEKSWARKNENDRSIINTLVAGRRGAEVIRDLITSALQNLVAHERREHESDVYVRYNIFVLTGAWDIVKRAFDVDASGVRVKPELSDKVYMHSLIKNPRNAVRLYQFYGYRKPGRHWSERQTHERLFEPRVSLAGQAEDQLGSSLMSEQKS